MIEIYKDVISFHRKFDLEEQTLNVLPTDVFKFRIGFLFEELDELAKAHDIIYEMKHKNEVMTPEILEQYFIDSIDALHDLIYVALGTLDLMGIKEGQNYEHWKAIQKANMEKERANSKDDERSKRKHSLDVVKPEGWVSPEKAHREILKKYWTITNDIKDESKNESKN